MIVTKLYSDNIYEKRFFIAGLDDEMTDQDIYDKASSINEELRSLWFGQEHEEHFWLRVHLFDFKKEGRNCFLTVHYDDK